MYDIQSHTLIDLKPKHELLGLPNVIEYVPEQKVALASIGGDLYAYSFEKNDWAPFSTTVEGLSACLPERGRSPVCVQRTGRQSGTAQAGGWAHLFNRLPARVGETDPQRVRFTSSAEITS